MDARSLRAGACAAALILLATAAAIAGIKHDESQAVLVYYRHPDLPMERYAAGHLGIPEPGYARIYLVAAYRYLEGKPLSPEERTRWLKAWRMRAQLEPWPEPPAPDLARWEKARRALPFPLRALPKPVEGAGMLRRDFGWSMLCSTEAVDFAVQTLRERSRQYGATSAQMRLWVEGQDTVMRACGGSNEWLSPAPPGTPPPLRADREYQMAATAFYGGRFDEAAAAFRRIADDKTSHWRVWAPYLLGRALLWKARTTEAEPAYRQALLTAQQQFFGVLANAELRTTHAAAERLLARCLMITDPRRALERLGDRISRGLTVEADFESYLNAFDSFLGDRDWIFPKPTPARKDWPADTLSQWLLAFRPGADAQAINTVWRNTRSRAWLYAALWNATGATSDDIIEAGAAASADPNALPAMRFVTARALAHKQRFADSRKLLDSVITSLNGYPSARNRALILRTQIAVDAAEFLRLAPKPVIYPGAEWDSGQWPDTRWRAYAPSRDIALRALPRFDAGAATVLNEQLSLQSLVALYDRKALPKHLQDDLAVAIWTRALLLNRVDVVRRLEPVIESLAPSSKQAIRAYLSAPTEEDAALALLTLPGARPFAGLGYGRRLPIAEHDNVLARNWWYRLQSTEMYDVDLQPYSLLDLPLPRLPWISPEETQQAAKELALLRTHGERGLEWIATRVVSLVRRQPTRSDAAELLYRVIIASRNGWWSVPPDRDRPSPGLKAAWDLLQTRYPSSHWAHEPLLQDPGLYHPN